MKRTKLLSLTLAFALILTTVSAGAGSVFAATSDIQSGGPAVCTPIEAVNLNLSTDFEEFNPTPEYSCSNPAYVPVSIPMAGSFVFTIRSEGGETTVGLFETVDGSGTAIDGKTKIIPAAESADDFYDFAVNVEKAGTYYLKFQGADSVAVKSVLAVKYVPATKADSTTMLESGQGKYVSVDNGEYRYFKITVPGTRHLQIHLPIGYGEAAPSYKVKVLDSSKKRNLFNGSVHVNDSKRCITYAGVPRGTYYIGVSTETASCYLLNVTAVKVNEKSGNSKARAKKIFKGKVRYGVITAIQPGASDDWYKFVVTRKQKVRFEVNTLTGGSNGGFRFTFYNSKKAFSKTECNDGSPKQIITPSTKNKGGYLAPGTYWIKVQKYGSKSGYYELKWK